jgi:uncharacterized phage-associated protein
MMASAAPVLSQQSTVRTPAPTRRIAFNFDPEKFTQAAVYVISRCPTGMTKKKLFKLLYFADKEHLLRYARPILKDHYINMDQGPVPSASYDLVKANLERWPQSAIDAFAKHIEVSGMYVSVRASAGTDLLSKSDIEILDGVIDRYGLRGANYLSALSHRDRAWLESQRNRRIDYALFFDEPEVQAVRALVEYDQPIRDISKECHRHRPTPAVER